VLWRELGNFGIDIGKNGGNTLGGLTDFFSGKAPAAAGQGLGDQFAARYRTDVPSAGGGSHSPDAFNRAAAGMRANIDGSYVPPDAPAGIRAVPPHKLTFLEALSQAESIADQLGIGQAVDYSPAVNQANSSRDRNSAYLGAIYNQLRGELDKDRPVIQQNFGDAIQTNADITKRAQDSTSQAYGAAQEQATQEGQALGMQGAQASINTERPGLMQQAANAVESQADRGQSAQTMYNTKQSNALEHNTNIRGASNFAETRSQSDLNNSLAQRLAELSVQQSEANAQAQNERSSSISTLGQYLYGDAQSQSQQDYENTIAAMEAQAAQIKAQGGGQAQKVDLATFLKMLKDNDINLDDAVKGAGALDKLY
jgi:hypothetical protein